MGSFLQLPFRGRPNYRGLKARSVLSVLVGPEGFPYQQMLSNVGACAVCIECPHTLLS